MHTPRSLQKVSTPSARMTSLFRSLYLSNSFDRLDWSIAGTEWRANEDAEPPSRYSLQAASRCQPAAYVQRLESLQAYRKGSCKGYRWPSDLKNLLRCASVCSSDAHKL